MKVRQLIMQSVIIAGFSFAGAWNVDSANAKVAFSVKGPFGKTGGSIGDIITITLDVPVKK